MSYISRQYGKATKETAYQSFVKQWTVLRINIFNSLQANWDERAKTQKKKRSHRTEKKRSEERYLETTRNLLGEFGEEGLVVEKITTSNFGTSVLNDFVHSLDNKEKNKRVHEERER